MSVLVAFLIAFSSLTKLPNHQGYPPPGDNPKSSTMDRFVDLRKAKPPNRQEPVPKEILGKRLLRDPVNLSSKKKIKKTPSKQMISPLKRAPQFPHKEIEEDLEPIILPEHKDRPELLKNSSFLQSYYNWLHEERRNLLKRKESCSVELEISEKPFKKEKVLDNALNQISSYLSGQRLEVLDFASPQKRSPSMTWIGLSREKQRENMKLLTIDKNPTQPSLFDPHAAIRSIQAGIGNALEFISSEDAQSIREALQELPANTDDRFTNPSTAALLIDPSSHQSREKVMQGLLGLVKNKDPQVRIHGLELYRRLIPDMAMIHRLRPIFERETSGSSRVHQIDGSAPLERFIHILPDPYQSQYTFSSQRGRILNSTPYNELHKILQYALRTEKLSVLREQNPRWLLTAPVKEAQTLWTSIDEENMCAIPFNWFSKKEAPFLFAGLGSAHEEIVTASFKALVRMIRSERTHDRDKREIMAYIIPHERFRRLLFQPLEASYKLSPEDLFAHWLAATTPIPYKCEEPTNDLYDLSPDPRTAARMQAEFALPEPLKLTAIDLKKKSHSSKQNLKKRGRSSSQIRP